MSVHIAIMLMKLTETLNIVTAKKNFLFRVLIFFFYNVVDTNKFFFLISSMQGWNLYARYGHKKVKIKEKNLMPDFYECVPTNKYNSDYFGPI